MSLVLRARAVWKSYAAGVAGCSARIWVLRGVSLDVERGECVAILGAPHAGTTTLLHCLAGLRRADAGSIEQTLETRFVGGAPSSSRSAPRRPELLLCDARQGAASDENVAWALHRSRADRGAVIVATHDLARVRDVADRVLLLRHGRLCPVDRASGARRVAERPAAPPGQMSWSAWGVPPAGADRG